MISLYKRTRKALAPTLALVMLCSAQAAPGPTPGVLALNQPLYAGEPLAPDPGASYGEDQLFPRFQLELQGDSGEGVFVLGLNSFTALQLVQFLMGFTQFLEEAHALADGQTLVLRQDGNQGYLALAASRSGAELAFTLTLHAEAPAAVTGDGGVHSLGLRIADQLLTPER
jgi:hypothetical protein